MISRFTARFNLMIALVLLGFSTGAFAAAACPLAQGPDDIDKAVAAICASANSGKAKPPATNWFDMCGQGGRDGFGDSWLDLKSFASWLGDATLKFPTNVSTVARAGWSWGWDKAKQGYNWMFGPDPAKGVDRMAKQDSVQARSLWQKTKDRWEAIRLVLDATWTEISRSARLFFGSEACLPWGWKFKFGCQFVQQLAANVVGLDGIVAAGSAAAKTAKAREMARSLISRNRVVEQMKELPVGQRVQALRESGGAARAGRAERSVPSRTGISIKRRGVRGVVTPQKVIRTRARQQFVDAYETKTITDANQNRLWMAEAAKAKKGQSSAVFYDVENSVMKHLNDSILKDKSLVTAITNFHKQLMMRALRELRMRNPGLEVLPYSDFKSLRYAFKGKIPADLEEQLAAAFMRANTDFANELRRLKLVRVADKPETWFKAGTGATADKASVTARAMRDEEKVGIGSYTSPVVQARVTGYASEVVDSRRALYQNPRLKGVLESVPGALIPRREVYDLARKYDDPEKLAGALSTRFGTEFTAADAADLQRYIKSIDRFSAALHVEQRTIVNLDRAEYGGFTADLRNVGSTNQFDLSVATAGASRPEDLLTAGRRSEEAMTVLIQKRLEAFRNIVGDIAKCSGDDCVGVPLAALSRQDKEQLLTRLAEEPLTREIRMGFIGPGVTRIADRTKLSTHAELIEKGMRQRLSGVIPPERLESLTFGIDMQSKALGTGDVGWLAGVHGPPLSAGEKASIDQALSESVAGLNTELKKSGDVASYKAAP